LGNLIKNIILHFLNFLFLYVAVGLNYLLVETAGENKYQSEVIHLVLYYMQVLWSL